MAVAHLEDERLQQFFDGELPPEEESKVRQVIEASAEERARLEALERLRSLLRIAAEDAASDLDSDGLYGRIRHGIDHPGGKAIEGGLRVVGGAPGPVEGWKVWIPTAAGLAVAAAVLLAVLRPWEGAPVVRSPQGDERVEVEATTTTVIEPPLGSEIEEVDFGENTGTVFAVQGEAGEPIAVVWIDDAPM